MHGDEPSPFGESEARRVLEAGWRQGSVCRPPADLAIPVSIDREKEWLVVCTQSCTVVSPNLANDPHIEFLVAKPIGGYKPNSQEATGKTIRRFHLPISGHPGVAALDCDINRRFVAPRSLCLTTTPDAGIMVSEEASRNLAGWISRYYTRVALPNELVIRAEKLFDIIKAALKKNTERRRQAVRIHRQNLCPVETGQRTTSRPLRGEPAFPVRRWRSRPPARYAIGSQAQAVHRRKRM